jgi:riboflavin synthase
MFTGIVTEVGRVTAVKTTHRGCIIGVRAPKTVSDVAVGDSIAVSGVCLTVTRHTGDGFECEAVAETLDRSTLGSLVVDSNVNLERPMAASGRFDGHIVQGHVDGVGTVSSCVSEGDAKRIRVALPHDLAKYIVEKGSIAVDGTSLTVTAVNTVTESGWFEIVLIPHTLVSTTLGELVEGSRVNLEVDVFAKYVERMTEMSR